MSTQGLDWDDLLQDDSPATFQVEKSNILPTWKGKGDLMKPGISPNEKRYEATLRFLPNVRGNDVKTYFVSKCEAYLKHPNGEKRFVNFPKTSTKDSPYWSFKQNFFNYSKMLKDAEKNDAPTQKISQFKSMFNQTVKNYTIAQIIEDEQYQQCIGTIQVVEFGSTIESRLVTENSKYGNPWSLKTGRLFQYVKTEKSKRTSYDESAFLGNSSPYILIDGKMINIMENGPLVKDFLINNSPNLDDYVFVDWDSDTQEWVTDYIKAVNAEYNKSTSSVYASGDSFSTKRSPTTTPSTVQPTPTTVASNQSYIQPNVEDEIDDTEAFLSAGGDEIEDFAF